LRAFAFVALAACGAQQTAAPTQKPAPTESAAGPTQSQTLATVPAPTTCKTNDDCAMSITRACCSPCSVPPFADFKSEVDTLKRRCSEVECAKREVQECKPTESIDAYHAECRSAACVAVRNVVVETPTAPATLESAAACATDAECIVTNTPWCCERCQADAYVTSQRESAAARERCAIVDCSMDRSEMCARFAPAALYRAVCRAHKCAGIKR
jgi:hypothetical protein